MKILIRTDSLVFCSPFSPEQILNALRAETGKERFFRLDLPFERISKKTFEGTIEEKSFSFQRIINYNSSFLPIIKGTIVCHDHGTDIEVKMGLSAFAILTSLLFLPIIVITLSFIFPDNYWVYFSPLVYYLVLIAAYRFEASLAKDNLQRIFKAKPQNN